MDSDVFVGRLPIGGDDLIQGGAARRSRSGSGLHEGRPGSGKTLSVSAHGGVGIVGHGSFIVLIFWGKCLILNTAKRGEMRRAAFAIFICYVALSAADTFTQRQRDFWSFQKVKEVAPPAVQN